MTVPACFACGETDDLRLITYGDFIKDDPVCKLCWDTSEPTTGQSNFTDLPRLILPREE